MTENKDLDLELSQYLEILLRRRWIVVSAAAIVFLTSAMVTFTTRPVYQASAMLVIEKERGGGAIYANGTLIEAGNEDYYQTQYKLLQSDSLTRKVYEDLGLESNEDFREPQGLKKLHAAVTVSPVVRSRLVYVRAQSHDPKTAAAVANALSQSFVEQNLSNQLFISKEVLQALQIDQGKPEARRVYDALPAVVNNPLIQNLKAEYAKLEAQAADLSRRYTPRHPTLAALRSNSDALKRQIDIETDKIVQSLKTELSGQLKGNNVRIIDPANVPDRPVRPRKLIALILGLLAGLAAGLGAAYFVEMLDQSIRTQEDVERKLQLPFLGMVPYAGQPGMKPYEPMLSPEPSFTSEAFRNLRTMIDFAGVSQKANSLLVTSTLQEEGKTYVASNLAVVFTQLGEKVLLIDGDLRRPNLHKSFGLSAARGLSNYLASGASVEELEQSLQKTDIPGLQVLVCGPKPPNPAELLNTPRLSALMVWAQSKFDRIIIDCTPIFPISDTLLWGRLVRSAVFVVRYGKTRVPIIQNARQRMETGGIHILGTTVNAARPGGLAYASYGYYYRQYYHSYHEERAGRKS